MAPAEHSLPPGKVEENDPPASEWDCLVPVLSVERRDDRVRVVSKDQQGATLRRVLAVAGLTPPQASVLAEELLAAIATLHELGAAHGELDADRVLLGVDGRVWLRDWALAELAGRPLAPRVAADVAAARTLVERLSRGLQPRVGHDSEQTVKGVLALHGLAARTFAGVDQLLEEVRTLVAPIVPDRERTLTELGAIANALCEDRRPTARAAKPDPGPRPRSPAGEDRPAARKHRARGFRVRPPRRLGVLVLSLLSVALVVATVLVYGPGPAERHVVRLPDGVTLQVASPHLPAVHLPSLLGGSGAAAGSGSQGAGAGTGHQPRAAPVLAPPSAGAVGAIRIQPVRPDCSAQATCPLRVDVQLTAEPRATQVSWTLDAFDRCTGALEQLPGGSATALAGWPYVSATSSLPARGSHPVAVFAVTTGPTRASSPPLLLPDSGARC